MKIRWEKNFVIFSSVFFLSFVAYLVSEGILRANTLAAVKSDQPAEYGRLVDWLPAKYKLAIEYRAKYLDYKEKMEKARETDVRVDAMFNFADYIKVKDKDESDQVFAEVAKNPEYRKSRRAYKALAKLLLNKNNPYQSLTIKEYHDYINSLEWIEDKLQAWTAGRNQLNSLRVPAQVHLDFLAPLMENKMIYTNFDTFYGGIQTHANNLKNAELVEQAKKVRDEIKAAKRGIPNNIIQAPLDFRKRYADYKQEITNAKDAESRLSSMIGLASLLFDKDNGEASQLLVPLRDNPEYVNCKNYYNLLARMLLERRVTKQVSLADYQQYINAMTDEQDKLSAWEAGYSQLTSIKASPATFVNYLKPLIEKEPKYREYRQFIERLETKATEAKDEATATRAADMIKSINENYDIPWLNPQSRI